MRKFIAIALALFVVAIGVYAGGFEYLRTSSGSNIDSLVCITTTPDSTGVFLLGETKGKLGVFLRVNAKNATKTALAIPLIDYKLTDWAGKYYSADSNAGWTKLFDSSHVTITAADTVRWYKALDLSNLNPVGIKFRGTSTAESTKVYFRIHGDK